MKFICCNTVQQHAILQVLDKRRIFLSGGGAVQSIPVAPFTLVGATTDPDGLIQPARWTGFSIILHLDYYSQDDLVRNRPPALPSLGVGLRAGLAG